MTTIFKSLIGTLAAVLILACTAGASLYFCHRMDIAIGDAVARQFAELQSNDAVCGVAAASDSTQCLSCACEEMSPQAVAGAVVDSKVAAILIEELSAASPAERRVWTNLLRSPSSAEAFRHLFAHYHGSPPTQLQQTSEQVHVACAEAPQQISSPCEAPQQISLTCSCRDAQTLAPEELSAEIKSAIDALQEAEQLLTKAVHENLRALLQLREDLIEQRQEPQCEADKSGECPEHNED